MTDEEVADLKANCDLAIEGRDVKIKELEKENERLKGDLELWESGGCRATNLFECGVVKELKEELEEYKNGNFVQTVNQIIEGKDVKIKELEQQIEKMKCCANCSKYDRYNRVCSRTKFSIIETLCNCSDDWELRR